MKMWPLIAVVCCVLGDRPVAAQQSGEPGSPSTAVSAVNGFTLALFDRLAKQSGNLVVSPFSAENVFALAWTGSKGLTRAQMATALHFPEGEAMTQSFGALLAEFKADEKETDDEVDGRGLAGIPFELHLANAIWLQQNYRLNPTFVATAKDDFGASVRSVDFAGASETARAQINDWVAQETAGKLKELIPAGALDARTVMTLANAVYFKARWRKVFDETKTTKAPFHIDSFHTADPMTMNVEANFRYAKIKGLRALELPYFAEKLSMIILLPNSLKKFEKTFGLATLTNTLQKMEGRQVNVFLPRFEIESALELSSPLKEMGMHDAFAPAADFSGIAPGGGLFVGNAMHKALITVDEKGTEATAATSLTMTMSAGSEPPPPVTMRIDHPFLFLIRHNTTGAILFVGRVVNP